MCLIQQEKTDSFDLFYKEYKQQVFHYLCRKIDSLEDAEDLTADIFEYCYRKFNSFDSQKASRRTWLYVIVNSRFKNYLRSKRCFEDIEDYMEFTASDDAPLEQAMEMEQERKQLAWALEHLPQRRREIVIQRYFREKNIEEIAQSLNMTQVNVRVQLFRAIKQMKEWLEKVK